MAENNSDIIAKLSAIQESLEAQSSKLGRLFGEIEDLKAQNTELKAEIKAQSHAESIERILKSAKDLEYRLFKGGF